ncbi:uncharacterized protein FA14DRAFT_27751 [Meira miltonrushii]|uniref:Protein-S-isoprenylcysteine O-methyltransferase n=1 Tax=Meira miltonrushii TaxID=1280837 RepID=A0A316VLQ6_9BASI|nr:uncharacterized protein FA14DRAFT_27751 [Meira miltonrushii]PWN38549.1 hypothetical protein FA14DRAFT_27751 [Meira miltonrushii]
MADPSLAIQAFIACVASAANYVSITDPSKGRMSDESTEKPDESTEKPVDRDWGGRGGWGGWRSPWYPSKGRMPDDSNDKPVDRVWGSFEKYPVYSKIMLSLRNASPFLTLSQAGYLLYLASNPKKVKFPTKYATSFFLVTILGASWRIWCFRTLDKFFTFRLQVQDDQKVIKSGPYRYLAHPSYLGQSVNVIGIIGGTYGPFNVWMNMFSTKTIAKIGNGIALNSRLLAQVAACGLAILYMGNQIWLVRIRIPDEEAMLRKRFGEEYDEYLSRRWRVIPFIY